MAYDYRKMTPEERTEIIASRQARGHPRHAPPHPIRQAGWYFITGVNFEHQRIMDSPERRDEFEAALLEAYRSINADIAGWVILANHHHSLAGVDSLEDISKVIGRLHGRTSYQWNIADGMTGKRRVWYKYRDSWIRNERHYYQVLNYIHYNPVRHNYVSDPYTWKWSSINSYFKTYGRKWLREGWRKYPYGDFGSGWDDYADD